MKRKLSVLFVVLGLFLVTGCEKDGKVEDNTATISYTNGKGIITVSVPKDAEGNAKYIFTTTKPEGFSKTSTFYLVTDSAMFGFSTSGTYPVT